MKHKDFQPSSEKGKDVHSFSCLQSPFELTFKRPAEGVRGPGSGALMDISHPGRRPLLDATLLAQGSGQGQELYRVGISELITETETSLPLCSRSARLLDGLCARADPVFRLAGAT